jgi:hypothetical protein
MDTETIFFLSKYDEIVFINWKFFKGFFWLQHFEHLVTPLAYTVEIITNELGVKSVIQEIMRFV